MIDRNALGFDQLKPPGLAELAALGADGNPIAPADAARDRAREIAVDCDHGPVIAVAGRFVHTSIRTTVGAAARRRARCGAGLRPRSGRAAGGSAGVADQPGGSFVVDGVDLSPPATAAVAPSPVEVPVWRAWGPDRREVQAPPSTTSRVLVIPESINPGWVARTSAGARLTPVAVNGWQQGWVVPAGRPRHHHADLPVRTRRTGWAWRWGWPCCRCWPCSRCGAPGAGGPTTRRPDRGSRGHGRRSRCWPAGR